MLHLPADSFFWRLISHTEDMGHVKVPSSSFHRDLCMRCLDFPPLPQRTAAAAIKILEKQQQRRVESENFSPSKGAAAAAAEGQSHGEQEPHAERVRPLPVRARCVNDGRRAALAARGGLGGSARPERPPRRRRRRCTMAAQAEERRPSCAPFAARSRPGPRPSPLPPHAGPRVLALDGGGVKGLVEIVVLDHLVRLTGGIPVHELFDVIGGTSTGGLLALVFGAGRMSCGDAQSMYVSLTQRIFQRHGVSRRRDAGHGPHGPRHDDPLQQGVEG